MSALIESAGLEVESIWPTIFAKTLAGKDINDLVSAVGAAGSVAAPAAAAGAPAAGAAAGGAAAKEEKKKEVAAEESDDDMGFGLFD